MVGRVAPLVLVADSTALGVWTYLAMVLLEEYTWQCSCSSVFCHGGKGSPSGALCRRSSSTVHRSIYYQTLLSVLCYHLDSLVCLFVVFMFHPVTQGNENQSINHEERRHQLDKGCKSVYLLQLVSCLRYCTALYRYTLDVLQNYRNLMG